MSDGVLISVVICATVAYMIWTIENYAYKVTILEQKKK